MNLEETVAAFGDDEIDLGSTVEYSLMIARQHGLGSTLSPPFHSIFASSPQVRNINNSALIVLHYN